MSDLENFLNTVFSLRNKFLSFTYPLQKGRGRCGGGPSVCQSQEGTQSRWDTEQYVDHRTSGQSRDTRRAVQPSVEEQSIPYPMEGGSAGAISDGKCRYNKVSISILNAGPVIDKYRYFPFIF